MPTPPIGFSGALRKAENLARNLSKLTRLLREAVEKADRNKGPLVRVWEDLRTLVRMVGAWGTGSYRDIPWQTIILATAAVVYFVNPFDILPDFVPFLGFLDDSAVIGFVIASIAADVARFRDWESAQTAWPDSVSKDR